MRAVKLSSIRYNNLISLNIVSFKQHYSIKMRVNKPQQTLVQILRVVIVTMLFFNFNSLFGKEYDLNHSSLQTQADSLLITKIHHCGWLISWAGGTPTFGGNGVMFSTFYSQTLSRTTNIELGLHYLSSARALPSIGINGMNPLPTSLFRLYSISWTGDITYFWQPFADNLGLGIGPAIQWWQRMDNPQDIQRTQLFEMRLTETFALGGNLKIEYAIPLTKAMDIGIRGQIHGFLLPVVTGGFDVPSTGSGSFGVFLRGNW